MLKAVLRTTETVMIALVLVIFSPLLIGRAAWRAYRYVELHAVYRGDAAARDRAEYKRSI